MEQVQKTTSVLLCLAKHASRPVQQAQWDRLTSAADFGLRKRPRPQSLAPVAATATSNAPAKKMRYEGTSEEEAGLAASAHQSKLN